MLKLLWYQLVKMKGHWWSTCCQLMSLQPTFPPGDGAVQFCVLLCHLCNFGRVQVSHHATGSDTDSSLIQDWGGENPINLINNSLSSAPDSFVTVAGLQAHSEDSPQWKLFSLGTQLLNMHSPPLREIHFCPCPSLARVMVLGFICRSCPLWTFEFLLIILMFYLLLRLLFRLIITPLASLSCAYILLVPPFPLSCHPSWLCAPMFHVSS